MVFGDFGKRELSVPTGYVANRARFPLPPERVLETWVVPQRPAPRAWMARLHPKIETAAPSTPGVPEPSWSLGSVSSGRQNRVGRNDGNERGPQFYRR